MQSIIEEGRVVGVRYHNNEVLPYIPVGTIVVGRYGRGMITEHIPTSSLPYRVRFETGEDFRYTVDELAVIL